MAIFTKTYNPNRSADWNYGGKNWRLSRSKIDLFIECPRCFYLDNKLGTGRVRGPAFTLNVAVDALFKKEFDTYRSKQEPHPIMDEYGLDMIPFNHKDIDVWRDNFRGLEHLHEQTGLLISGAVDDVWQDKKKKLYVVDYKATSKTGRIESLSDSPWEAQYQRQIGVYQWLLQQMGFDVAELGYFVYANASTDSTTFDNILHFETTLVSCAGEYDWIDETLVSIKSCLEADTIPKTGDTCEFCPYREAAGKKLQALHAKRNM